MTLTTPDMMESETAELLSSVIESVKALRKELESLRKKAAAGEELTKTTDRQTVASATGLLETCQKVENRLAECRNKNIGIARGGYALDLDQARIDIGSKLDRIRTAGCTDTVSE